MKRLAIFECFVSIPLPVETEIFFFFLYLGLTKSKNLVLCEETPYSMN